MSGDNQEDVGFRSFWRPYGELIERELQPYAESTDATDQKLVVHLRKSEETLKRKLRGMRFGTAITVAQEFVESIRGYGRTRRAFERALPRYEECVQQLRVPSSLKTALIASLQTRVTSGGQTKPPIVRPRARYPLTEEELGSLRQYAAEVATDLFTRPNSSYNDGWVPTLVVGDVLAKRVFGENYREKNRQRTVAMMLGHNPQIYGLEKRKDSGGKGYLRPLRE